MFGDQTFCRLATLIDRVCYIEIHQTSDQTASNIAIVLVFDVWSKKPKILIELSCWECV